jgi:signal transduction histidine kinase
MFRGETSDTGVGIPPSEMPRLFRAFDQMHTSTIPRHCGTGLDLTISKRLCELMHGDITATSIPGAGSTFMFSIRVSSKKGDTLMPFAR